VPRRALFLGGPWDGEWRDLSHDGLPIRLAQTVSVSLTDPATYAPTYVPLEYLEYRRAGLWATTHRTDFYRPEERQPSGAFMREHRTFEIWTVNGVMPPDEAVMSESWNPARPTDDERRSCGPIWAAHMARPSRPQTRPQVRPDYARTSVDAHSVSFSTMTAEAEAEMAEWDKILRGASSRVPAPTRPQRQRPRSEPATTTSPRHPGPWPPG
jgi:hypothetical protein